MVIFDTTWLWSIETSLQARANLETIENGEHVVQHEEILIDSQRSYHPRDPHQRQEHAHATETRPVK